MTESKSRIRSLDGLRALAIGLVLLDHSFVTRTTPHSWWLATGAHAGVLLFFVLSGFLITTCSSGNPNALVPLASHNSTSEGCGESSRFSIVTLCYYRIAPRQFSWRDLILSWTFLASLAYPFSITSHGA